jgi:hypothetical protein
MGQSRETIKYRSKLKLAFTEKCLRSFSYPARLENRIKLTLDSFLGFRLGLIFIRCLPATPSFLCNTLAEIVLH